jgi:AmmeMemoRadiSam system protein A
MNLTQLAKKTVEVYVKEGKIISPPEDLTGEFLEKKSGTFVTIKKEIFDLIRDKQIEILRGCIGTYLPTKENIAKEVISNAIAAATEDYRFGPVRKEELPHLSYTVYILRKPQLVKDLKELDPRKYGIIVKTIPITQGGTDVVFNGHLPYKSGLLLPDLKGVDAVEKQISIACQKGGINPTKEKILIYKFTVKKYQ